MIGSDAQKFWTLSARPGLITDGFFRFTRNPNYLGEVLIYLSFGVVAQSPIALAILLFMWLVVFNLRMRSKDHSLARKTEFPVYASASGLFFPRVFQTEAADGALWAALAVGVLSLAVWLP